MLEKKSTPERTDSIEIELKELKELKSFAPPRITLDPELISQTSPKLDTSSFFKILPASNFSTCVDELKRIPKKFHMEAEAKNETEGLISRMLDDIWLEVFPYLDISTLVLMMVSCKKVANLANDEGIRERLYTSKKKHQLKNFLLNSQDNSSAIRFFNERSRFLPIPPQHPLLLEPVAFIPEAKQQVYNDNPPGQGFVMNL